MSLAPIILFTYNRPVHLLKTLSALQKNAQLSQSALYIYCDGPKPGAPPKDILKITKVREIAASVKWCENLTIIHRDSNYGLQKSVIEGVSEIVNKHGKVIVLEDDIITSSHFLQYMNDGLNIYQDNEDVLSIGAFNFFASGKDVPETFFVPIPDCWGWATWKNRWELFEPNAQLLLNKLREAGLIDEFNLRGKYNFESLLIDQIKGNVSSWAIRWQAVAYLTGKLTLYPKFAVTENIGFDAEGTHTGSTDKYSKVLFAKKPVDVTKIAVVTEPHIINKMIVGYDHLSKASNLQITKTRVKKTIKYFLPIGAAKIYRKLKAPRVGGWWQGNYSSWQQAQECTRGYDDKLILEKALSAALKVKNKEAAFERDTVLFDKIEYNWPILTSLLKAAIENNNCLSVVDFGGSLGSFYFQSKDIISDNIELKWKIVEQQLYVNAGNQHIKDNKLSFHYTIEDALEEGHPHVLLLSCVVQYLEDPFKFINEAISYGFKYIMIDRLALTNGETRLTVQNVPPEIYESSYPAWFINERQFLKAISNKYQLLHDFAQGEDLFMNETNRFYWKSYIYQLKENG